MQRAARPSAHLSIHLSAMRCCAGTHQAKSVLIIVPRDPRIHALWTLAFILQVSTILPIPSGAQTQGAFGEKSHDAWGLRLGSKSHGTYNFNWVKSLRDEVFECSFESLHRGLSHILAVHADRARKLLDRTLQDGESLVRVPQLLLPSLGLSACACKAACWERRAGWAGLPRNPRLWLHSPRTYHGRCTGCHDSFCTVYMASMLTGRRYSVTSTVSATTPAAPAFIRRRTEHNARGCLGLGTRFVRDSLSPKVSSRGRTGSTRKESD
ncbi:hypothetical protein HDK64DRAFT_87530 [Phyllosticta capitalensis]